VGHYDIYFRAEVRRAERLTPHMVRIVLGGADLAGFRTSGFADERLVVVFPAPGESEPPAPLLDAEGHQDYPDESTRPEMRSYTVRAWSAERAELVIDFVAHDGGVAATWALGARPGDVVYVTEATGWYAPPAGSPWQLLVADMTGLPALGRIVEELAPGARAHVIAEVLEDADRQPWASAGSVTYDWRVGSGNGAGASALLAAVQAYAWPSGPGYLWFAGEAAESRAVRRHVRSLGWPHERFEILGYWRVRKEEWMARYDRIGGDLEQIYTQAIAEGRTSDDALELYDEALAKVGL